MDSLEFRYQIISSLVDQINSSDKNGGLKCRFNKLALSNDSIALALSDKDDPGEVSADVTGTAKVGVISLDLVYRVVSVGREQFDAELGILNFLSSLAGVVNNFMFNIEGGFVTSVKCISSPKMTSLYKNGIRDYAAKFTVRYERMV